MNQRNTRRAPRRRITGRFYAFLTVLLVLVVMAAVLISTRSRPQRMVYNDPVYDPGAAAVQTAPPVEAPTAPPEQNGAAQDAARAVAETGAQGGAAEPGAAAPAEPAAPGVGDDIELAPLPAEDFAVIEDLRARADLPQAWTNILLLGSDSRDMKKIEKTRCDSIMIVSVNGESGQLKITSIMRDTVIDIPGRGPQKINAATYYGGPRMMMQLLNQNLGLNITQYAVVNFGNMARLIDTLGGVFIDVTKEEAAEINKHMGEIAAYTMEQADYLAQREGMRLKTYGKNQLLNGIQAVTYARIRYIDSDYQRTQRQRNLINAMMARVKDANPVQLMQVGSEAIKLVATNVGITNAVGYAMSVLGCKLEKSDRVREWRIPGEETSKNRTGAQGQGFYDVDYPELANRIYKFIYQS